MARDVSGGLGLMCILAHPDDESMGTGSILARYGREGVATSVVCATRGERGWYGPDEDYPGPEGLGAQREAELRRAAECLGVRRLELLDYIDGDLDQAEPVAITRELVGILRDARPQVVVTFPPDGIYGHPDHVAISQFASAAVVVAADARYAPDLGAPHRVAKFYYYVLSREMGQIWLDRFGDVTMEIDGVARHVVVWPDWAITTRVAMDEDDWRQSWAAVQCHVSQLPSLPGVAELSEDDLRRLWWNDAYYRVYSDVNGGRRLETDLFEGLR